VLVDDLDNKGKVASKDVSLILNNEESKFEKVVKQSRLNNNEASLSSYKGKELSKELSYKNLRNFLWA
jgi:hypothetical protein